LVVRRVRITCHVLLAGVTLQAPPAQAAAVELLEAVVLSAGGVLQLQEVRSSIGRYPAMPGLCVDLPVGERG
jgi:hypothetical protein